MASSQKALEKRLNELKDLIREHDRHYFVEDRPVISDYEYDKLFMELKKIEFEKAPHRKPMLSLANTFSVDEVREFDERIKKFLGSPREITYFCELKFDG